MAGNEQELKCDELLPCIFALKQRELDIFKILHGLSAEKRENGVSVSEIADIIGKDRSTAQRAIQKLAGCNMVEKVVVTIPHGGYQHLYRPRSMEDIQNAVERCGIQWFDQFHTAMDK